MEKKETDIIESLKKLVQETEPKPSTMQKVDEKLLRNIVQEQIKTIKLTRENLGEELIGSLSAEGSGKVVKLELPSGAIVRTPEANTIPAFLKIIDDLLVGNNVFLYGEAGTGKTTLAERVADVLKIDYLTINCNQWTSPLHIIGGQTIEGYAEGTLIRAWKEGKMLILDEMPKLDSNTAGLLNDALAKSDKEPGAIIFNGRGEPIKKHKNFCCIATGNTTGKGTSPRYNGNNKQDLSLLDRFSGNFYEVGFNRALEKSLLHTKVYEICDKVRNEIIRVNADEIMTLRTMLQMNKVYHLEMKRELGILQKVNGGKTLIDSLNSYFAIMNKDKAELIKANVNLELFSNTYKDRGIFMDDLERSNDPDLKKASRAA